MAEHYVSSGLQAVRRSFLVGQLFLNGGWQSLASKRRFGFELQKPPITVARALLQLLVSSASWAFVRSGSSGTEYLPWLSATDL